MHLTDEPAEVIAGVRAWKNTNGYTAVLLHHSADPETASLAERRASVPDEQRYLREHELDFSSWAGKPVYGGFDVKTHVRLDIGYIPTLPVWVSFDFGFHHPAAVFAQVGGNSETWVLGELLGEDMTLFQFINNLYLPYKERLFPQDAKMLYSADPAGRQVSDKSEHTSFSILSNYGIYPYTRKSEINEGLTIIRQRIATGTLKVHPRCKLLIEALKGGYRYPEPTPGLPEPMLPAKDGYYEHLADALRYFAVNGLNLVDPKKKPPKPEPTFVDRQIGRRDYHDPEYGDYI